MIICFIYNLNACLSIIGSYYEFNYLVFLILGNCVAVPPSSALRVSIILAVFLICTCTTIVVLWIWRQNKIKGNHIVLSARCHQICTNSSF